MRVFLLIASIATCTACQSTANKETSLAVIPDEQLDEMEVKFTQYPLPTPERSIKDIQEAVATIDFSHKSVCSGGEFYEVYTPPKSLKASEFGHRHVQNYWRDAATEAFRYGDFEGTLEYIQDGYNSVPPNWWRARASLDYAKSVYFALLGDVSQSEKYFGKAGNIDSRSNTSSIYYRRRVEAYRRETAAIVVYAKRRYREAEIRLRELRSGWANSTNGSGLPPLGDYAITGDVFINYLLILSLANQDKLVEADAEARYSLWLVEDILDLAWIMDALAVVFLKQGRYADAEWVLQKMADFFTEHCAPSHYFVVYRTYLRLAQALIAQGKLEMAQPNSDRVNAERSRDKSGLLDQLLLESPY